MSHITMNSLIDLRLTLGWEKSGVRHRDTFFADEANLYRDLFPPRVSEQLLNKPKGESRTFDVEPGELIEPFSEKRIHKVRHGDVDIKRIPVPATGLRQGRVYPKGLLSGLVGVFSANVTPFRVRDLDDRFVYADFNHPLAGLPLSLSVEIVDVKPKRPERGGMAMDWLETAGTGPGIQSRINGAATDFFSDQPFDRDDTAPDTVFYEKTRLVSHIDELARKNLADLYGRYLKKGDRVLDLMSSWQSHLPEDLELERLDGLGMNPEELDHNPRLTGRIVQDLNVTPKLPFADQTFDAVICSLSVEYLTRPFDVFRDVARVLKPGGQFIVTFSNRWFPTKTIRLWPGLHEFERPGLITEYMLESGAFDALETASLRGWPRPYTDDYFPGLKLSDPIYMVRGLKR